MQSSCYPLAAVRPQARPMGGAPAPTTLLLDTFTGSAGNINGTTSDNGKTRTQVAGLQQLDGSGNLIWADDGSGTTPAKMKWGTAGLATQIVAVIPANVLADGVGVAIWFGANNGLTSGCYLYIDSVTAPAINVTPSGVSPGDEVLDSTQQITITITLSGGNASAVATDGVTTSTVAPISMGAFASNTVYGAASYSDGDVGGKLTSVTITG